RNLHGLKIDEIHLFDCIFKYYITDSSNEIASSWLMADIKHWNRAGKIHFCQNRKMFIYNAIFLQCSYKFVPVVIACFDPNIHVSGIAVVPVMYNCITSDKHEIDTVF